jgi:hypothetical protein
MGFQARACLARSWHGYKKREILAEQIAGLQHIFAIVD